MSKGSARLLQELSTMDSCEAKAVNDKDHVAQNVPSWCELQLILERSGREQVTNLRRHDGELIIEVLHEALHPWSGKSVVGRLWEHLDDTMDRIMADVAEEDDRGFALGLATALAMMTRPYAEDPDVDVIRVEAMERWEAR